MTYDTISPREFGRLETQVETLTVQITQLNGSLAAMSAQVMEMRDTLAQAKGGWKTALTLVTVSGAIGALAAHLVKIFTSLTH